MKRPPRQRNLPQVPLDDTDKGLGAEPSPQPFGQCRVKFDRNDPCAGPGERPRQRAVSGTQIEDQVSGSSPAGSDQLVNKAAVS